MDEMEIIACNIGKRQLEVGLPSTGTIHINLICTLSPLGKIEESEIRITGITEESRYRFLQTKSEDIFPIELQSSSLKEITLPTPFARTKPKMPTETKLLWYKKLKKELEEKGLI
ncbi:hypothetical protein [Algoriphagus hitonicola]|uniref:Uncharacterized protein n=1 Tax=Algoriphagus hitonicola TaxID=435880 RepID=A0A1I2V0W4_9BACT|nr:hypothetical protein [Algoriphagus hitonicola]SFG80816.1 hypothetical protein SAMN04487988_108146 [Algoriphagus hitonicola]